jgi:hypothetical protein
MMPTGTGVTVTARRIGSVVLRRRRVAGSGFGFIQRWSVLIALAIASGRIVGPRKRGDPALLAELQGFLAEINIGGPAALAFGEAMDVVEEQRGRRTSGTRASGFRALSTVGESSGRTPGSGTRPGRRAGPAPGVRP